jgi:hypothetical protein
MTESSGTHRSGQPGEEDGLEQPGVEPENIIELSIVDANDDLLAEVDVPYKITGAPPPPPPKLKLTGKLSLSLEMLAGEPPPGEKPEEERNPEP